MFLCVSVRADVVAVKSRPPLVNTQVLRLQEGKVVCRAEDGSEVSFPIEQIEYMQITGWQMFDLAEKQRRAGDWHRAAASYERAIADLIAPPTKDASTTPPPLPKEKGMGHPSEPSAALDRMTLVKCRLIQAADTQTRFERALELYLEVAEHMPALVDTLRPTHLPANGTAWLATADKQVSAVIARHAGNDLGRSLAAWKASWPRPTSAPAASDTAPIVGDDPQLRADLESIASLVNGGRSDDALARIAAVRERMHGRSQADLFYWQGRALELKSSAATTQPATTSAPADANTARAGLAYMRIVAHYPVHARTPECLFRAGELCRKSGQNDRARQLWNELVTLYPQAKGPDGMVWADKAREELK